MSKLICNLEELIKTNIQIKKLRKVINRLHTLANLYNKEPNKLYSGKDIAEEIKKIIKEPE